MFTLNSRYGPNYRTCVIQPNAFPARFYNDRLPSTEIMYGDNALTMAVYFPIRFCTAPYLQRSLFHLNEQLETNNPLSDPAVHQLVRFMLFNGRTPSNQPLELLSVFISLLMACTISELSASASLPLYNPPCHRMPCSIYRFSLTVSWWQAMPRTTTTTGMYRLFSEI